MIKAIETAYNGCLFRSRLEARWAVFFDTLGVKYEYEKEGFDLGKEEIRMDVHRYVLDDTRYLPDFWLPRQDCWFEVKGECPTQEEYAKARLLAHQSGKYVYIASGEIKIPPVKYPHDDGGNPPCPVGAEEYRTNLLEYDPLQIEYYIYPDWPVSTWNECIKCKNVEINSGDKTYALSCSCIQNQRRDTFNTPQLRTAYKTARQARFEHQDRWMRKVNATLDQIKDLQ
jgi:hypothetical protein